MQLLIFILTVIDLAVVFKFEKFLFTFCVWYNKGTTPFFCMWRCRFPYRLLKTLPSSIIRSWSPWQKSVDHNTLIYFWTLKSIPLICMSILILVSQYLDFYVAAWWYFEMEKWASVLLFQYFLTYSEFLSIPYDLRIGLSLSKEKPAGIL